jgi:hypothetical protein
MFGSLTIRGTLCNAVKSDCGSRQGSTRTCLSDTSGLPRGVDHASPLVESYAQFRDATEPLFCWNVHRAVGARRVDGTPAVALLRGAGVHPRPSSCALHSSERQSSCLRVKTSLSLSFCARNPFAGWLVRTVCVNACWCVGDLRCCTTPAVFLHARGLTCSAAATASCSPTYGTPSATISR